MARNKEESEQESAERVVTALTVVSKLFTFFPPGYDGKARTDRNKALDVSHRGRVLTAMRKGIITELELQQSLQGSRTEDAQDSITLSNKKR